LGARRVGKTELLKYIFEQNANKSMWLNGEDADTVQLLQNRSIANYQRLLQGVELLFIDEAQTIPSIGNILKLMIDNIKPLHIFVTGSSAFDLVQVGEPLVGRSQTYHLYPLAQLELNAYENTLQTAQNLEERLLYGSYPEVYTIPQLQEKRKYLSELVNSYLLKDILAFEDIRNANKLKDLLKLIAYQIGHEVSLDELGRQLGISKNTVERYLDLLSKVFVLYKVSGFSRNLRKEITKTHRWYFADNGVRNALLNHFSPLDVRQDVGALWENYVMIERIKRNTYNLALPNSYFWRTYDQQEIDLVEEKDGELNAFEFKWAGDKAKIPIAFAKAYPEANFEVIHKQHYLHFIA
jgi:predicted AAA+ superfamily ATPase